MGNASSNTASEPEWLCGLAYKDFWDKPVQCKIAQLESLDLKELFSAKTENNPNRINDQPNRQKPTLKQGERLSSEELSRKRALAATGKFDNEADDDADFDGSVPGFVDASQSGDDYTDIILRQPSPDGFPCPPKKILQTAYGNVENKDGKSFKSITSGEKSSTVYNRALEMSENNKREEGGWIYMNKKGQLSYILKNKDAKKDSKDEQTAINLSDPPLKKGWIVVGNFHTHDGNQYAPSETVPGFVVGDIDINTITQQIPGVIIARGQGEARGTIWNPYGPARGFLYYGLPERCK